MKPLIIGTAGHVDHGKSTLIKALTGIDPDRLREEQQRGMTIDLGFAWLDLPRSGRVGIVDVPGHERFLKNMLAGAGGVDLALLVVAADEGVMPQTREHLDILSLLDVHGVVVALTKCDLADGEMRALAAEDVRTLLEECKLPEPTIVETSAVTGSGLDELRETLDSALERMPARDTGAPARMPVDRVFTMTGFGTVVTGTLVAGTLAEGASYVLVPGSLDCRIRGLQVHGKKVSRAVAGQRVAANLTGVAKEKLHRGQMLSARGACEETLCCDALITLLRDAPPLKHGVRVRLHIGTAEVIARVALGSSMDEIGSGETGAVQLRCESPIACAKGDRFVLRRYSPGITIGGGQIVLPIAPRRKRAQIESEAFADALSASPEEAVLAALDSSASGLDFVQIGRLCGLQPAEARDIVERLGASGRVITLGERILTLRGWEALKEALVRPIRTYHASHTTTPMMPKATWAAATPIQDDPKALDAALARLSDDGLVVSSGAGVRLADFHVQVSEKQQALVDRVVKLLLDASFRVPTVSELPRVAGLPEPAINEVLRLARNLGRVVKVSDDLYYPVETVEEIKRLVREKVGCTGGLTVAAFRDLTQTSRKYAVPLVEYLDSIHFTRRVGDDRVLAD